MRLPDSASKAAVSLSLSVLLAGCGGILGGQSVATTGDLVANPYGPEADYPQVLGEPFTMEGELYTPEDVYSYDAVGVATLDADGGQGVSVAHKTLPVPSYVEVTSLESGKTIVARIERRGPMTSKSLVALSPGAAAQLGIADGTAVRVRRTNPPEAERAELRAGRSVAERLATPESLLAVLRKKLPVTGSSASLALAAAPAGASWKVGSAPSPIVPIAVPPSTASASAVSAPAAESFDKALPRANKAWPLPAVGATEQAAILAADDATSISDPKAPAVAASGVEADGSSRAGTGKFVIQAAAFSSKDNAQNLADKLEGGFVTQSGKFYRVRVGPYATRGQADAALAKVRAAGYSDATVVSAG